MNFSDLISNVSTALFSPDNQLMAVTNGTKIILKSLPHLNNIQVFSFPDQVNHMEFSPDSKHILVVMSKKNMLEARSVAEEDWLCKIEDNLAGIVFARWTPASRHIITFSDFQLKASIYSLADKNVYYIKNPKYPDKGLTFSNDGKFMALAERRDAKDYIGIYYCGSWKLLNHFQTDTYDLSDIMWSSDNNVIIAWETLLEYKMLIYCPATGILAKFQPYQSALGIKTVSFNKSAEFLSIGSFDEKIRILNCLTWKLIVELEHSPTILEESKVDVFKEEEYIEQTFKNPKKNSQYMKKDITGNFKISSIKVANDKPNPPLGVGLMEWSNDGQYVATRNDNMPNTVWIWDITSLTLKVVLIHLQPVKTFSWSARTNDLAICTGSCKIFFWSMEGASICEVPYEGRNFNVANLFFSQDGRYLLILDKNECLLVYPPSGELEREEEGSMDINSMNSTYSRKMKSVNKMTSDNH